MGSHNKNYLTEWRAKILYFIETNPDVINYRWSKLRKNRDTYYTGVRVVREDKRTKERIEQFIPFKIKHYG